MDKQETINQMVGVAEDTGNLHLKEAAKMVDHYLDTSDDNAEIIKGIRWYAIELKGKVLAQARTEDNQRKSDNLYVQAIAYGNIIRQLDYLTKTTIR